MKKFNVSPENQMSKKQIKELKNIKENDSIIVIKPGVKMPLFIYISNNKFKDTETMNFMAAIIYDYKDKTIELKGRMRFESSGRKMVFSDPNIRPFTPKNLEELKESCHKIDKIPFTKISGQPTELEFAIDESIDNITQKMNDSNKFNIGIVPTK